MKVIIKVNEKDTAMLTRHPLYEVIKAKKVCDELASSISDEDVIIHTVSTDAVQVYEEYGKLILGLNIEYYLNEEVSTITDVFKSFNKSFDWVRKICETAKQKS